MIGQNDFFSFFQQADDHMLWNFTVQHIHEQFTGRTGRAQPSTAFCSRILHPTLCLCIMSMSLLSAAAVRPALRMQVAAVGLHFLIPCLRMHAVTITNIFAFFV